MHHHFVNGERRELDPRGPFAAYLDPASTAVVSIDMHAGHLSERPDCPCPAPRGRQIIDGVNAFHADARAHGVPVIHVRSELRPSGRDDVLGTSPSAWRLTFPQFAGPIPGADQHALTGTQWTEFVTEVLPGDEIVSGKKRLSAFYPTDLDFLLRQMGIRTVVIDGIMADCCVLNSSFEASNLGYRVVVPADLVRGTNQELEHAATAMISLHFGLVTDSSVLTSAWSEASARV
ncbi:cysteine hydrolase family protein [Mycobacterium sp. NAZ190054]|uniref:cysteine hydrolase family protein n=1 Tax=Mycobacterium sp. NAZ190054 TaxID=1747766 RepID=UPI00079B1D9F|nr:isochorismatase family cysteine hydrolase [Mycobacterium sp. NAZ190054]KWX68221.1 isochorismatase [Mycobacterium sp. NAZ190054]